MASGFALGGAFEGFGQSRRTDIAQQQVSNNLNIAQQHIKLEQQRVQNEQQRALFARADKDASALMSTANDTIQALQLQGKTPAEISKAIQPIVQPLKRLMQSAGRDPSSVDAQIAVSLSKPGFNPASVTGGGSQPATTPDVSGTPSPPGQNITSGTVTGVDYGPVENMKGGKVVSTSPAPQVQQQPNEVDRLTNALMRLPATPEANNIRDAIKARLGNAISQSNVDASVHFAKTEDGNEVPIVVRKQGGNVSVTDINGNPFVPQASEDGGNTNANVIAEAIETGKQPPVFTGLYRQGKAVRAALARKDVDVTSLQMQYQAAQAQIRALNSPQMTRFVGLGNSVVNTIDEVKNLSEELQNSGVPLLNAAKLQAYIQTQGNTPNGQLASKYVAAVGTLKEEFANLANGGYAPTDAAWTLANQQINGNYGVKQLSAALTEVQRLIRYRLQAVPNMSRFGPGSTNTYTGQATGGDTGAAPPAKSQAVPYTEYFK